MEEKKEKVEEKKNVAESAKEGLGKAKDFAGETVNKMKTDKDFLKKVICYVVGAVVVIGLVWFLLGAMGPKGMAKKYMKAYEKLDSKTIVKMMYKDQADDYSDILEEAFEALEDEDFKIKEWEITDVTKLSGNKLEKKQDAFEDKYDVKPSKITRVKVKVKAKADDKTDTEKMELYFGKIKGKWYLIG